VTGLSSRLNSTAETLTEGNLTDAQVELSEAKTSLSQRLDALAAAIDNARTRLLAFEQPVSFTGERFLQAPNVDAGLNKLYSSMILDFKVSQQAR
jgi:hypothetical protein